MSRHISASADLATKYAVGEIVDMLGVPQYYDAGNSQWMQGNVWFPASAVSAAVVELLRRTPSNASLTTQSESSGWGGGFAPAVVGNVAVVSTVGHGGSVLVITESGVQMVDVGALASPSPSAVQVFSDGTYFWAFAVSLSYPYPTAGNVRRSTDGKNWQTPPGTFNLVGIGGSAYSVYETSWYVQIYPSSATVDGRGHSCGAVGSQNGGGVFFCGARFLVLALDANSTYVNSWRAVDAMSWGSADSASVLGATNIPAGERLHFHRGSGLKCLMQLGSTAGRGWRYTADGGVTWVASVATTMLDPGATRKRPNTTMPDKVLFADAVGNVLVTTDCGANYTMKTPQSVGISSVAWTAYKGAKIFLGNNTSAAVSADDGATWAPFSTPAGFSGQIYGILADDTAFYLLSSTGQLFVSTDGDTWTQRILPAATQATRAIRIGNQIMLSSGNNATISNDGGVTWSQALLTAQNSYSPLGPIYKVTTGAVSRLLVSGSGSGYISTLVTTQMLSAGVAAVRAGQSSPNAVRGNTTPMIRVA